MKHTIVIAIAFAMLCACGLMLRGKNLITKNGLNALGFFVALMALYVDFAIDQVHQFGWSKWFYVLVAIPGIRAVVAILDHLNADRKSRGRARWRHDN